MIQVTVVKIVGYGPWTLTLGGDREHRLQMIQASLYASLQDLFAARGCLVFPNRGDEFFVASNGLDLDDHIRIQREIDKSYDLKLSMSIGFAQTPFAANRAAHRHLRSGAFLDEESRIYGSTCGNRDAGVTILHMDIEDLTSVCGTRSPYEISSMVFGLYSRMCEFFLVRNSLAFFMGGDNFMVMADGTAKDAAREFIDAEKRNGLLLNCGVGTAGTAREAARLATTSLDMIREIRDSGGEKPEIYETSCS